jgi:SAM-dependent methyltransferase
VKVSIVLDPSLSVNDIDVSKLYANQALKAAIECCQFDTVLDIGSGIGKHADVFHQCGKKVTTIDLSTKAERETDNRRHITADYNEYQFGTPFDLVWASHILEHQLNPNHFLKKVHVDVREGGWVAITVPPLKHAIVGGHVSLWNAGLLIYNLVLSGFNCRTASILKYGYNISVIVQKTSILNFPHLNYDTGDIKRLGHFFPEGLVEGFNGNLSRENWPPVSP